MLSLLCDPTKVFQIMQNLSEPEDGAKKNRHLEDFLKNFNIQNNLQIQKYFTLALLVLLVANIISGCATGTGEVMNESVSHQTQSIPRDARASKSIQLSKQFLTYLPWWISPDISPLVVPVCASRALVTGH